MLEDSHMLSFMTYFWCHKFWRATESARSRPIPHLFFAETVIGDLDVTIKSQQDIVKFQISVDDTVLVKVFECQAYFGCVESGHISRYPIASLLSKLTVHVSCRIVHAECAT
jgi:hypothetical protein